MMKFLYDRSIRIFDLLIFIASITGNKKAQLLKAGRAESMHKLIQFRQSYANDAVAWFHCASLGEFEQARPVVEWFKKHHPRYKIVISFYSPSGYEIRKNYSQADLIVYLPSDTKQHAQSFTGILKPSLAFFIKYEFWLNYLDALNERHTPLFLVCGAFRKNHGFFRFWGGFMRKRLHAFTHFFVQQRPSGELLQSIGFTNWSVSGDTRFDRVQQTAQNTVSIANIESFKGQSPLLVIGSAWQEDMDVLIPFINAFSQPLKVIIAPHEIHTPELQEYADRITKKSILYSRFQNDKTCDVLFIDNIGMLASIYAYADYAYVGGAFGKGLHNILEPAVFGPPVFFGPNIKKFPEATWLITTGGAFSIGSTHEFTQAFEKVYTDLSLKTDIQKRLQSIMLQACGATSHITQTIPTLVSL